MMVKNVMKLLQRFKLIGTKLGVAVAAIALTAVILPFLSAEVIGEVAWHLKGQVTDERTNSLAGVRVSISGMGKVVLSNQILGTSPKKVKLETVTDAAGKFALAFRASDFQISFEKTGFAEKTTNCTFIGTHCDDTNQTLHIMLHKTEG